MAKVTHVDMHGPAWKAGLRAGDDLRAIGVHEIRDVLDLTFRSYEPRLLLHVERDGKPLELRVRKDVGEPLGLEFESYLIDNPRSCHNKCVFCFIDQMPPGMRETLYFKDDDARLSFLQGNYVTLTNMSDEDIDRIIEMRISPINISIHTTNPELRARMLNNRFAGEKLKYLRRLADGGVEIKAQIVLCPGWNDREELERTLRDLMELAPALTSCSIVPVGLTKYREGLTELSPVTREDAEDAIERAERWGERCLEKYGARTFFCSDELFFLAEREMPPYEYYEDFPQYENGVGMTAMFLDEFEASLASTPEDAACTPFTVATGTLFAPVISKAVDLLSGKCHNISGKVIPIVNHFFGEAITVAGLVTCRDLIEQVRGNMLGCRLIIPSAMLRAGEHVFLDDGTVEDVERELGVKVIIQESEEGFIDSVLREE